MKNSDDYFPYESMPVRLEEFDEKNKLVKRSFFQCKEHLQKYLERTQLTNYKVAIKDGEEFVAPKAKTKKDQQKLFSDLNTFFKQ
jgi:hypothetical protein